MEEHELATKEELLGLTDNEIKTLSKEVDLDLPEAYLLFLKHFGHSAGLLSPWMTIYAKDLAHMRDQFHLLSATSPVKYSLPREAHVIGNWESVFDFIVCNGEPDPEVLRIDLFNPQQTSPSTYCKNYSSYLENLVHTSDCTTVPSDFFGEDLAPDLDSDNLA